MVSSLSQLLDLCRLYFEIRRLSFSGSLVAACIVVSMVPAVKG